VSGGVAVRAAAVAVVVAVLAVTLYPPVGVAESSGVSIAVSGLAVFGVDPVAAPLGGGYVAVVATGVGLLAVGLDGFTVVDDSVRARLVSGIASAALPGGGGYAVALVQGDELRVYLYSGGSWEERGGSLPGLGLEAPYRLLGLAAYSGGLAALVSHAGGVAAVDALSGEALGYVAWRSLGVEGVEAAAAGEGYAVVCSGGSLVLLAVDGGGLRVAARAPAPSDGCVGASVLGGYVAVHSGSTVAFYDVGDGLEVVAALRAGEGYRIAAAGLAAPSGSVAGIIAVDGGEALVYAVPLEEDDVALSYVRLGEARVAGLAAAPEGLGAVALADPNLKVAIIEVYTVDGEPRLREAWEGELNAAVAGGTLHVVAFDGGFAVLGPTAAAILVGDSRGQASFTLEQLPSATALEALAAGGGLAVALRGGEGYSYAYILDPLEPAVMEAVSLGEAVAGGSPWGVAVAGLAWDGRVAVALAGEAGATLLYVGVEGEPVAVEPAGGTVYLAVAAEGVATLYAVDSGTGAVRGETVLGAASGVQLAAAPGEPLAVALPGEILLLDPDTLTVQERIEAPQGEPVALEWSPEGGRLLAAYAAPQGSTLLLAASGGVETVELDGEPLDAAWIDEGLAAVILSGGVLAVYDVSGGAAEPVAREEVGAHAVEHLDDGRLLALGPQQTLTLIEVARGQAPAADTGTETTTVTATTTETATTTVTRTETETETVTATETVTVTQTETETETVTQTVTVTQEATETETVTQTVTAATTVTETATETVTATLTVEGEPQTYTVTATATETVTESTVATETVTETVTLASNGGGPTLQAVLLALALILASTVIALLIDRRRNA